MFARDALSGRLVAFSSSRSKRPHRPKQCPFCPGNEYLTPPAVLVFPESTLGLARPSWRRRGRLQWRVRCFENAFPVVYGRYERHEVIVETPRHGELFEDYSLQQLDLVFSAFQNRFVELSKSQGAKFVMLFKNFGDKSGASIPHEHSQVLSFPFVPDAVKTELKNQRALDVDFRRPVLVENRFFKAVCPAASAFPYQVRVLAKDKKSRFGEFSVKQGVALLALLQSVVRKVKMTQGAPDYTMVFHAPPKGLSMRFFVDVLPRKAVWGGIELGAGVLVNFKKAGEALRELKSV